MIGVFRRIHDSIFPSYNDELKKATNGCASILDIGCGVDSPVQYLPSTMHRVGVDAYAPSIEASRKRGIHNEYYEMNVDDIGQRFAENSFDCVLASDFIEHVTKEQGLQLIENMERIAKHKIIIFTPRGFLPQDEYEGNPWQKNISGWEVAMRRASDSDFLCGRTAKPFFASFDFLTKATNFTRLMEGNYDNRSDN